MGNGLSTNRRKVSRKEGWQERLSMYLTLSLSLLLCESIRRLFAALNNCGFVSTDNIANEPAEAFAFLMDSSMLGVGVGFDTKVCHVIAYHPSSAMASPFKHTCAAPHIIHTYTHRGQDVQRSGVQVGIRNKALSFLTPVKDGSIPSVTWSRHISHKCQYQTLITVKSVPLVYPSKALVG